MTRAMALVLGLLLIAACKQEPVKVEPPQTEYVVLEPQRQKIPGWALQELPEDAPRERSTPEAVALACRRLNIIRHANCLTGLLKRYDKGLKVEPLQCKLNVNEGCTP